MTKIFKKFGIDFIKENMIGPNSMRIIEELSAHMEIKKGMRILDLGCGRAMTSIYLASEYDVTVIYADLWESSTEVYKNIKLKGLENRIIPIQAGMGAMPFADEYFDIIVSVDAFHYFGADEAYLSNVLGRLLKTGGQLAVALTGIKEDFEDEIPEDLKEFIENGFLSFHSHKWWRNLLERTNCFKVVKNLNLDCTEEAWDDWLVSNNPVAKGANNFYIELKEHLATPAVIAVKK